MDSFGCVACVCRTLHRVTEIQNILNRFNLSPQILAHLGSPSDSLVLEVLALQNILLLNANRIVQVRTYDYIRTLVRIYSYSYNCSDCQPITRELTR